jgi:hypothetical protein
VGDPRAPAPGGLTERSSIDDIIDLYKRDVDVSLIRERLKRSIEERLDDLMELQRECIVIGGVAATVHGSARLTRDIDVVYPKDFEAIAELETIRDERQRGDRAT